jgi:uracil-DNA glycosylase family protein
MERAVKRDLHKMHAFVRFRETTAGSGAAGYFAWFEPQHEILREAAEFFVQRFPNHDWTIATPDGAAVWKAGKLHIVAPPDPADRPRGDDCEELWRTYYRSICNVVRINPPAMQREMPRRYWRHLPESAEIDSLIRDGAANFARDHHQTPETCRSLPVGVSRALPDARLRAEDAQSCHRCELWRHATQAVVGEGDAHAHVMLVGEQPGDEEDLRGRPFVGPAGKVLDLALAAAGLDRRRLFLTNAVRHFKWEPRGKRRLHQKPVTAEVRACNIWLEQEIAAVKPVVIVALGATALRALTGAPLSVEDARAGMFHHPGGARILATYHPAAILRADGTRAGRLTALLEADLRSAAAMAAR